MCRKCKSCRFFVFRPGGPAGYTKRCLLKKANNPEITGWVTNGNDGYHTGPKVCGKMFVLRYLILLHIFRNAYTFNFIFFIIYTL